MDNRARERVFARVEGFSRRASQLGAVALTGGPVSVLSGSRYALLALIVFPVLVAVAVISAIWTRDAERRKAALDVLDRLLRWKGGRS